MGGGRESLGFSEWNEKPPHNLAPTTSFLCHHFFHTTSLQETAPGFPKPHSVFGNSLMLSPLCLQCPFRFYMWQNSTQHSGTSSSLFLVKLSLTLTYFSPAKLIIYPFSVLFIPKGINAYHNIRVVICLL